MARLLADEAVRVYVCARSEGDLRELSEKHPSIYGKALDVRDTDAVSTWVDEIGANEGHIDILINNAGTLGPRASLVDTSAQAFRDTLDVNVVGVFNFLRSCYPWLKRSERPRVINISSSVGRRGRAEWGAYSASKFAVEGLTEIAADELGEWGAAVVSFNPGGTATDMRAEAYPEEDPSILPSSEEVGATIVKLVKLLSAKDNNQKYSGCALLSV